MYILNRTSTDLSKTTESTTWISRQNSPSLSFYWQKCRDLCCSVNKGKGKILPRADHEGSEGEQLYGSTLSSASALVEGRWSTPRPGRFTPGKDPGTHCTGGWVGPRAGLDGCGKILPPPGFDPRTVQPVASHYTDWAIPAAAVLWILL